MKLCTDSINCGQEVVIANHGHQVEHVEDDRPPDIGFCIKRKLHGDRLLVSPCSFVICVQHRLCAVAYACNEVYSNFIPGEGLLFLWVSGCLAATVACFNIAGTTL